MEKLTKIFLAIFLSIVPFFFVNPILFWGCSTLVHQPVLVYSDVNFGGVILDGAFVFDTGCFLFIFGYFLNLIPAIMAVVLLLFYLLKHKNDS